MAAPLNTYEWLKQLPSSIITLDSTPLIGFPPKFPWDDFSNKLRKLFEIEELSISAPMPPEWRSKEQLSAGLGQPVKPIFFTLSPQGGNLCWLMSNNDLLFLMNYLLTKNSSPITTMASPFQEGFYQFLALEVLALLPTLDFDKKLTVSLLEEGTLPEETCLSIDVEVKIDTHTIWGRLVISREMQMHLKERYAQRSLDLPLSQKLEIPLQIEAGTLSLTLNEWKQVQLGDFLILNTCSLKPDGSGHITLTSNNIPLFSGKLEEGNIQILEFSLYNEVHTPMNDNPENPHKNLPPEEHPKHHPEEDIVEGEEHEEIEHVDEDLEEEENWDDLEGLVEEKPKEEWPPLPEKKPSVVMAETTPVETAPEVKPLTPEEIPLSIVVEVARLQMSIKKVMELQPGNTLELNVRPENGVDLVVNGRRIAKAELLLLGDTLGVRILDIG